MTLNLSRSECLLIHRRRLGLTQPQAAKRWKIQSHIYQFIEYGDEQRLLRHGSRLPRIEIDCLEPHERCLILRRRSRKTQKTIATEMGCSRYWMDLMELGKIPCDDLLRHMRRSTADIGRN